MQIHDDGARPVKIEDVKAGDYIKRKPDAKKVYIRGDYYRPDRHYTCTDTEDMSREIFIKRGTIVYIGFTY